MNMFIFKRGPKSPEEDLRRAARRTCWALLAASLLLLTAGLALLTGDSWIFVYLGPFGLLAWAPVLILKAEPDVQRRHRDDLERILVRDPSRIRSKQFSNVDLEPPEH